MAAKSSKAAKARAAAAAPYVQRVLSDEELRDNVRVAIESAREAFARIQHGRGPAQVLDDKKFKRSVQEAASALKDASDSLRDAPKHPKGRRSGGLLRLLIIMLVAAGLALALSEDLREKVLDALFGQEEEFSYSSTSNGAASSAAPSSTPAA